MIHDIVFSQEISIYQLLSLKPRLRSASWPALVRGLLGTEARSESELSGDSWEESALTLAQVDLASHLALSGLYAAMAAAAHKNRSSQQQEERRIFFRQSNQLKASHRITVYFTCLSSSHCDKFQIQWVLAMTTRFLGEEEWQNYLNLMCGIPCKKQVGPSPFFLCLAIFFRSPALQSWAGRLGPWRRISWTCPSAGRRRNEQITTWSYEANE